MVVAKDIQTIDRDQAPERVESAFVKKAHVKPVIGQTCLQNKVGGRGCKVLATLHFMATAFIGADGQSSPSPPYLRSN